MIFSTLQILLEGGIDGKEIEDSLTYVFKILHNLGYSYTCLSTEGKNFPSTLLQATKLNDLILLCTTEFNSTFQHLTRIFCENSEFNLQLFNILKKIIPDVSREEAKVPKGAEILFNQNICSGFVVLYHRIFIIHGGLESLITLFKDIILPKLQVYSDKFLYQKYFYFYKIENLRDVIDHCFQEKQIEHTYEENIKYSVVNVKSVTIEKLNNISRIFNEKFSNLLYKSVSVIGFQKSICMSGRLNIQNAIAHIEKCYKDFDPYSVFLAFNGGKDCMVLLHLILVYLKVYYPQLEESLLCLNVQSDYPFHEVNDYVKEIEQFYNVNIVTVSCDIKTALKNLLQDKPQYKACLMGTRRTDPFSKDLKHFQMTDKNWPKVMRVSPLLDWSYQDIWDYLLEFRVPYCTLYDEGYTSLGNSRNTKRNGSLMFGNQYLPAYKLLDGAEERRGRSNL